MNTENIQNEKKYNKWIVALSIVIPLAVAALFGIKLKDFGFDVEPLTFLPSIYATINGITAIVLILAVLAIKKGNRKLHEGLMKFAISLSVLFLLMYIVYHMTTDMIYFGDINHDGERDLSEAKEIGALLYVYYFILTTHILLSIAVIPFVLITYVKAITNNIERHKKIARITFPLWLYVAVTGVIVYLMISPYYI